MAKKKELKKSVISMLSIEEIQALAAEKKKLQEQQEQEEIRQQIADLREKRKALLKEAASIDRQIRKLSGRKTKGRKGKRKIGIREMILAVLGDADGAMSVQEISASLAARGNDIGKQLGTYLSNMKKDGQVKSAGRGLYVLA